MDIITARNCIYLPQRAGFQENLNPDQHVSSQLNPGEIANPNILNFTGFSYQLMLKSHDFGLS